MKIVAPKGRLCARGVRRMVTTYALLAIAMLVAGTADAAEHAITGKKLALKGSKFTLLSTDAGALASGSPACPAPDSSMTFTDGDHTETFTLPCANWTDRGTVTTYKDTSGAGGPSRVKIARAGSGRLKMIGWWLGSVPIPDGPATVDVVLDLGGTIDRYCMSFSGTGDGNRFLVRDSAPGTCPECGNGALEAGESCDGSSDADCHGECQSDCTCPPPVCGNGVREASEACDGTDASACPDNCRFDCTCAGPCPDTPGDATACQAFGTLPECIACCSEDEECFVCAQAAAVGCSDPTSNDHCSLALTVVGCAAACCPAQ